MVKAPHLKINKLKQLTVVELKVANASGEEQTPISGLHADLTDVSANQHHNQQHLLLGNNHTISGLTAGHVLTATGADSITFQAPATPVYADISANDASTDVTGAELEELTDGSETILHSHAITAVYADISTNDENTDITGAELEELTDGSETALHTHDAATGFVKTELGSYHRYQNEEIGTITSQSDFHLVDTAATFITNRVAKNHYVHNETDNSWAVVTAVNSETDLTLDTNIFPDNDGDSYRVHGMKWGGSANTDWSEIIPSGATAALFYAVFEDNDTSCIFIMQGEGLNYGQKGRMKISNVPQHYNFVLPCGDNRTFYFTPGGWDNATQFYIHCLGWWI